VWNNRKIAKRPGMSFIAGLLIWPEITLLVELTRFVLEAQGLHSKVTLF
jgi:hypothetical protein